MIVLLTEDYLKPIVFNFSGFQLRFCRVDAENGMLSYFLPENIGEEGSSSNPRGVISLAGALVNPSDEDSRTFTINPATGEVIKLKATDARSRQEVSSGKLSLKSLLIVIFLFFFFQVGRR